MGNTSVRTWVTHLAPVAALLQADGIDSMMSQVDVVTAVDSGTRPEGDGQVRQCARNLEALRLEAHLAIDAHPNYRVAVAVLDRRQTFRIRSRACSIARDRRDHAQRLMGSLVVVHAAPRIKGLLGAVQIPEMPPREQFSFERSMKPFVFPVGLRVPWPTARDPDSQEDQPDCQLGQLSRSRWAAPWRTVVRNDAQRQSISAKHRAQVLAHHPRGCAATCIEREIKARVIVKHRERAGTANTVEFDAALEIHLPKIIGMRVFEALPSRSVRAGLGRNQAVPVQDARHGTWRRHLNTTQIVQATGNLGRSPRG